MAGSAFAGTAKGPRIQRLAGMFLASGIFPCNLSRRSPASQAITGYLNEPTHRPRRRLHVPGPFRGTIGAPDLRRLSQGDAAREPGDPRALERRTGLDA